MTLIDFESRERRQKRRATEDLIVHSLLGIWITTYDNLLL